MDLLPGAVYHIELYMVHSDILSSKFKVHIVYTRNIPSLKGSVNDFHIDKHRYIFWNIYQHEFGYNPNIAIHSGGLRMTQNYRTKTKMEYLDTFLVSFDIKHLIALSYDSANLSYVLENI